VRNERSCEGSVAALGCAAVVSLRNRYLVIQWMNHLGLAYLTSTGTMAMLMAMPAAMKKNRTKDFRTDVRYHGNPVNKTPCITPTKAPMTQLMMIVTKNLLVELIFGITFHSLSSYDLLCLLERVAQQHNDQAHPPLKRGTSGTEAVGCSALLWRCWSVAVAAFASISLPVWACAANMSTRLAGCPHRCLWKIALPPMLIEFKRGC
jgi:hypothetical protein